MDSVVLEQGPRWRYLWPRSYGPPVLDSETDVRTIRQDELRLFFSLHERTFSQGKPARGPHGKRHAADAVGCAIMVGQLAPRENAEELKEQLGRTAIIEKVAAGRWR